MHEKRPEIILISPGIPDPARLDTVMAGVDFACLRLSLALRAIERPEEIIRACLAIARARDVPVIIDDQIALASRLGLDGVHLTDGAASVRKARAALGKDAIIGAGCRPGRHAGMMAAEAGANYVSFGPVGVAPLEGDDIADAGLFRWWAEIIEVPVVAEGGLTAPLVTTLAPFVDFLAVGDEIWREEDPAAALGALLRPLA